MSIRWRSVMTSSKSRVNSGSSWASAVAAMRRSNARGRGLRPSARRAVATTRYASATAASTGSSSNRVYRLSVATIRGMHFRSAPLEGLLGRARHLNSPLRMREVGEPLKTTARTHNHGYCETGINSRPNSQNDAPRPADWPTATVPDCAGRHRVLPRLRCVQGGRRANQSGRYDR